MKFQRMITDRPIVSGLLAVTCVVIAGGASLGYTFALENSRAQRIAALPHHAAPETKSISTQSSTTAKDAFLIAPSTPSVGGKRGTAPSASASTLPSSAASAGSNSCNSGGNHTDTANLVAIIVNKKHCLRPIDFTPTVQTISCAGNGSATIAPVAANDFSRLCNAAKNAGVPLGISSSYRSYATQVSTYNYWVSVNGKAGADRYSARPGYSEHQTGLAIDFSAPGAALDSFTGTPQQRWIAANGWKYGFIQRYTSQNSSTTGYESESWHYRYVGTSVASQINNLGAGASLESLWGVPGGNYN